MTSCDCLTRSALRLWQVQIELNDRAIHLNQAATDIAAASHTNEVPAASNKFSSAYVSFMDTGMEMAGARAFPHYLHSPTRI